MEFDKEKLLIKPIDPNYYQKNLDLLNNVIFESHFLARQNKISFQENKEFLDSFLENKQTFYLIALYEKKLLGSIFALPRFEDLLIHTANIGYFVHTDYRGKGIGSILMENLIRKTKEKKLKILVAEVAEDNIISLALLKKHGFKEFGRLKQGMMKNRDQLIDLLYFSKHLDQK